MMFSPAICHRVRVRAKVIVVLGRVVLHDHDKTEFPVSARSHRRGDDEKQYSPRARSNVSQFRADDPVEAWRAKRWARFGLSNGTQAITARSTRETQNGRKIPRRDAIAGAKC